MADDEYSMRYLRYIRSTRQRAGVRQGLQEAPALAGQPLEVLCTEQRMRQPAPDRNEDGYRRCGPSRPAAPGIVLVALAR